MTLEDQYGMEHNILAITIAYPDKTNKVNGIFVKETVKAVNKFNSIFVLAIYINNERRKNVINEEFEDGTRIIRVYVNKGVLPEMVMTVFGAYKGLRYIRRRKIKIDIVHAHFFASAIPFLFFMKNKPLILSEYSSIFTYKQLSKITILIAKIIMRKSKTVLVGSQFLINNIRSYGINANFQKIGHPVNTEIFYYKENNPSSIIKFISVARLDKLKKISILIDSLEIVKKSRMDFHLDIIGDGPEMKHIKEKINELALETFVTLHGFQDKIMVSKLLQESNFFVLPSTTENQANAINEALCCGKPVVVPGSGSNTEIINENIGILVKPDDKIDLAKGILTMMENYQEYDFYQISEFGKNNYGSEIVGKAIHKIYEEIITRN